MLDVLTPSRNSKNKNKKGLVRTPSPSVENVFVSRCIPKSPYTVTLTLPWPSLLLTACMDLQFYLSLEAARITLSLPDVVPHYRKDDVYQELLVSPPELSFSGFDHDEQGKYAFKLDRLVGSSRPLSEDEGRLAAARSVNV